MMEVVRVDWDNRDHLGRWQAFLNQRPDSNYSDLPPFRPLFRSLYGHHDFSFLCVDDGSTVGGCSLYKIESPFLGRQLVSAPFFGRGGFYCDQVEGRRALLAAVMKEAEKQGVDFVEIRLMQPLPPPWKGISAFSEFDLSLDHPPENVWKELLSSNARQNVRKSRKQGLRFDFSSDPEPTYRLLSQALRDLGTPFHGLRFFELAVDLLAEAVTFSRVWQGTRLVATAMVVRYRDSIATPYIGSLRQFRQLGANYFHYWKLIEWAIDSGVTNFELGRSPRGSTHHQFKLKWGALERPALYSYLTLPGREQSYRTVASPSSWFLAASELWKRTPLFLARAMGPHLFRFIP